MTSTTSPRCRLVLAAASGERPRQRPREPERQAQPRRRGPTASCRRSGAEGQDDALGDPDRRVVAEEDVRDASARPRSTTSSTSGYSSPSVRIRAGPPSAKSESRAPGRPASRRSPRTTQATASPTSAVSSSRGVALERRGGGARRAGGRGGRPRSRRRAPGGRRARRASSSASSRSVASFAAGWPTTRTPSRSSARERLGADRVEVPDHDVDLEPELERAVGAAVGGDHGRRRGHVDGRALPRCHDHDVRFLHAFLRWHYPGQVLRVGGALAALSARMPELPDSLPDMLPPALRRGR